MSSPASNPYLEYGTSSTYPGQLALPIGEKAVIAYWAAVQEPEVVEVAGVVEAVQVARVEDPIDRIVSRDGAIVNARYDAALNAIDDVYEAAFSKLNAVGKRVTMQALKTTDPRAYNRLRAEQSFRRHVAIIRRHLANRYPAVVFR